MFGDMTGWKTKAGGVIAILTGVATIIEAVITLTDDGDFNSAFEKVQIAGIAIAGGFTAIGLGHKLDKGRTS